MYFYYANIYGVCLYVDYEVNIKNASNVCILVLPKLFVLTKLLYNWHSSSIFTMASFDSILFNILDFAIDFTTVLLYPAFLVHGIQKTLLLGCASKIKLRFNECLTHICILKRIEKRNAFENINLFLGVKKTC